MQDVREGVVRRYWVEDGLLYAKGGKLFVPKGGKLRLELMREHHDARWAGHPGCERMKALLGRHYYWPDMEGDIEAYVNLAMCTSKTSQTEGERQGFYSRCPLRTDHGLPYPWISFLASRR